jgi:DNA-binding SARP family transcriptional activator
LIAGNFAAAEEALRRLWPLVRLSYPELAERVAWRLGWLTLSRDETVAAAAWFSLVVTPPADDASLWPYLRRALPRPDERSPGAAVAASATPQSDPTRQSGVIRVHNLGTLAIERSGQLLPICKARKALVLLRYLLTRPRREASREELMELLWPEAEPQHALHSLHVTVNLLRRYLDTPEIHHLYFEQGYYRLSAAATWEDDASIFSRHCDEGNADWRAGTRASAATHYTRAALGYHGDYFADEQDLPWAFLEQERLLRRYLTILERLGQVAMEQQQYDQALDWFQALLARDDYREDIHRAVLRCYWQLGRIADLVRHYEQLARVMAEDLSVAPAPETQVLYRSLAAPLPRQVPIPSTSQQEGELTLRRRAG